MKKVLSSSLRNRILFQAMAIFFIIIALFVYTSLSSTRNSLRQEAQKRVDEGLQTFSLLFNDNLAKIAFDGNALAQDLDVQNKTTELMNLGAYNVITQNSAYSDLKKIISDEQEIRGLSFIDIVDLDSRILVSANSDKVGQTLSLKGFVENALENKISEKSIETISQEELINESPELAEQVKVVRTPTENQKTGWRDAEEENDGLALIAISMIEQNDQAVGAIVSGLLLNNNNDIPDLLVQKGGGVASVYLYDARIGTNQLVQDGSQRAIGTLASEDVVNTVYVNQQEYRGIAFEVYEDYLVAYQPIRNFDNEVIGSIARGIQVTEAEAGANDLRFRFIIIASVALVAIYILTYLLVRSITRPLKRLASNSYKIGRGNLDIDIKPPEREDEIGDLTHSFIIMTNKLKEYYTKLEDLVSKRTKELRQKVKDLEKARHSIEEEKNKSESILQNVGDGVLALSKDRKFIACNGAASEILDLPKEEIIGSDLDSIIKLKYIKLAEKEDQSNPIRKSIDLGKVVVTGTGEFALITKKKKEIPVTITATPLKDPNDGIHGGVVVIKDVTKEQEIDKMKSEFVSVASHQLRTPLSASKWFLEMLINQEAGKVNKEQLEYLDHTYKSNERMIALVNDLLNVSRIESGTIAIEPIPTDIDGMIKSVIFELTPKVKEKKLKVVYNGLKGGIPQIKIDPKLIRQVFQNLLSNAVKYTNEDGQAGVRVKKDKKYLTFEVFDTGVGIPKAQQPKVFKKFFRADNVITLQTEGTGLGLYVAKSVVDASGGKIWFKSTEGKGTSFFFSLPLSGSKRREGEKTLI